VFQVELGGIGILKQNRDRHFGIKTLIPTWIGRNRGGSGFIFRLYLSVYTPSLRFPPIHPAAY